MAVWTCLILLFTISSLTDAKFHQKRETNGICDPITNTTNKIQCYCDKDSHDRNVVLSADCYINTDDLGPDDKSWEGFDVLKNANKLTLTNSKGITLKYIPTKAIKHANNLRKIDVKYSNIQKVHEFAFANLTSLEEIALRGNQIEVLGANAFAHHRDLVLIKLDNNNIVEINRNVFVDLPSLQKLFLTENRITTIHDRAFIHLNNLKELEIDKNSLFSLNSETFSGLRNLHKLDLSSNALEVIGDNTFLPLVSLQSLNLEENKIQMLDEKAFYGLSKLQSLSLAHNKLTNIDNVKVFESLESLIALSLRKNQIVELKNEVMAPILNNFYKSTSSLDVEDNNFPCDCRLDWFLSLMNKTQNQHLKLSIENLKCVPDADLRERFSKAEETDKNAGPVFEDEEPQAANTDYEYYDATQLNGSLFYIDTRYLLNCSEPAKAEVTQIMTPTTQTTKPANENKDTEPTPSVYPRTTPLSPKPISSTTRITNRGVLNLGENEATTKVNEKSNQDKVDAGISHNEIETDRKPNHYTTSRLATVSAKPVEESKPYDDREMADEAKPDKLRAHRIIQENVSKGNNAPTTVGCVSTIITTLVFRLIL